MRRKAKKGTSGPPSTVHQDQGALGKGEVDEDGGEAEGEAGADVVGEQEGGEGPKEVEQKQDWEKTGEFGGEVAEVERGSGGEVETDGN